MHVEFMDLQLVMVERMPGVGTPFVSFIIPVLNGERDIVRCLRSIQCLHFPREAYEVIVMDNGSTDRTPHLVRELGFRLRSDPECSCQRAPEPGRCHGARRHSFALSMPMWS